MSNRVRFIVFVGLTLLLLMPILASANDCPSSVPLLFGQKDYGATVSVAVSGDNLIVTYNTAGSGFTLKEVHFDIRDSGSEDPGGVGGYDYKAENLETSTTAYSLTIPLSAITAADVNEDGIVYFYAHATSHQGETGWAGTWKGSFCYKVTTTTTSTEPTTSTTEPTTSTTQSTTTTSTAPTTSTTQPQTTTTTKRTPQGSTTSTTVASEVVTTTTETPSTTVAQETTTTKPAPAEKTLPFTGLNGLSLLMAAALMVTGTFIYRNSKA